jgi:hemolysin III
MAGLSLLTMPFAIIRTYSTGSLLDAIGVSVFMISIFLMFLASTLYHSMAKGTKHNHVFKVFDHIFIYVAIAGSYTPVALSVIKGWQGIVIVSIQWIMVIAGILFKTLSKKRMPKASVLVYLIMGWTVVVFLPLFLKQASIQLFSLILAGGVFYSLGIIFYAAKNIKYFHMIWHLFVNLGAAAHFIGIVFFLN